MNMMNHIVLPEKTQQLLANAPLTGQDADEKVRFMLENEYLRRLGQYRRTDLLMTRKYGMTFNEFVSRRITREKGYSWESESDAMKWETAVSSIRDMEDQLKKLREYSHV